MNATILNSQALSISEADFNDRLNALINSESMCHFFCIQLSGQESDYFGFENRPFFDFKQVKRKLESLHNEFPESDFYIDLRAVKTTSLDFDDESAPMWVRVWLNAHDWRLARLKTAKMDKEQLVELIPNYESVMAWQEKHNTKDACHYYFCQSFEDESTETPTSSSFTFNITDALAARLHFSKIMPNRRFRICSGLMTTKGLMSMDGGNISNFQKLINAHKIRLEVLNQGAQK